jgi:hypothetical protein
VYLYRILIEINYCFIRFLVSILIADRGWDEEIAAAYFDESLIRQVSWFVERRKDQPGTRFVSHSSGKVSAAVSIAGVGGASASASTRSGKPPLPTAPKLNSKNGFEGLSVDDDDSVTGPATQSSRPQMYGGIESSSLSAGPPLLGRYGSGDPQDDISLISSIGDRDPGLNVFDDDESIASTSTHATGVTGMTKGSVYISNNEQRYYLPELEYLETDEVSPYRLCCTFEVRLHQ